MSLHNHSSTTWVLITYIQCFATLFLITCTIVIFQLKLLLVIISVLQPRLLLLQVTVLQHRFLLVTDYAYRLLEGLKGQPQFLRLLQNL